ncbi:MAG: autotransporter assembly complex family protein [Pseudohongiella sp.]|nr:autotransporter assembly complex family protein [Pseudohongiella sp.]
MMCTLGMTPLAAQAQFPVPRINISGAPEALTENIRAHIGSLDARCNTNLRGLNRLLPTLRRDIDRAAQALGYYQATHRIQFTEAMAAPAESESAANTGNTVPSGCWQLEISIVPGEPVRFGDIRIEITDPESRGLFTPVLATLPMQRGQTLDHSQYERLKSMISSHAIENGFFAARFVRSELNIDLQNNQAAVDIAFEPGERYRFGSVTISPLDELSDDFLSRFLTFETGDDYSSADLIKLRQNFNDSQYFNQVAVTPLITQAADQEVPVSIDLSMRPRRAYSAGAGVSTDNGPRLRLNYEDRYINRRGHRLNADLAVSTLQLEPSLSYVVPLTDPVNDSLRFSAGFQRQETDSYISNTYRLGVTYRSVVWDNWVQNIFVNYQSEKAELTNVSEERMNIQNRTNSTISGINWARTRADDPIYPTSGWRLFLQTSGAHENLLSDITFAQFYGSAKFIKTLGPGRLLLRTEAATTVADEVLELPISVRFFTGGDQSVRGYQYQELGATNAEGEVVGGKHLLVGSVEYDIRVRGGWSVAAFVDSGNSFRDFGNMSLKESAGVGIRWLSPIGPIRFDVAKGLDDGSVRFHITMGPDL